MMDKASEEALRTLAFAFGNGDASALTNEALYKRLDLDGLSETQVNTIIKAMKMFWQDN